MTSRASIISSNTPPLNPACYPVLAIVADHPIHGYDVCRILQKDIGPLWRLGKSQVYALLTKLEKAGLVQHERVGQEAYPAKNIFSITKEGEDTLRAWVAQPVYHIRDMRLEFPAKLWFAKRIGGQQESRLIERQLEVCEEKLQRLKALRDVEQAWAVDRALELRLVMVEAVISLLESLVTS